MKNTGWVRGVLIVACSLSLAGAFVAYRGGWLQAAPVEAPTAGYTEVKASNVPPHWSPPNAEHMLFGSKSSLIADEQLYAKNFEPEATPTTKPATQPKGPILMPGPKSAPAF